MSSTNCRRYAWLHILFVTLAALNCQPLHAQTETSCDNTLQGRQVRFIAPAAAGGGWDRSARALAAEFEKYSGAQTYVLNVIGGSGYLATRTVLGGTEQLLTIGLLQEELIINPFAKDGLASLEDFHILGLMAIDDQGWLVREDFSLDELNGGPAIAFALGDFEAAVQLQMAAQLVDIPVARIAGYPGSAGAIAALLRGDIDITSFSLSSVNRAVSSNPLRAFIILSNHQSPEYPDIDYFAGPGSMVDRATAHLDNQTRSALMQRAEDIVLLSQTFRTVVMSRNIDPQSHRCLQSFIAQSLFSTSLEEHMAAVQQNFSPLNAEDALARLQTKERLIDRYRKELTSIEQD